MNLLTFYRRELTHDQTLEIDGERAAHILNVQKLGVGDSIKVGEIGGLRGLARVLSIVEGRVSLKIEELRTAGSLQHVDVVLALPRPQTLKKVLQTVAAMGVGRLMLIRSNRVEKSFFSSRTLQAEELERFLRLGLEQGARTMLPEVSVHSRFKAFVEDEVSKLDVRKLLAHPRAETSLVELNELSPIGVQDPVIIAVGPEGGWVDYEIDVFTAAGFEPYTASESILRVEDAICALLAQIELIRVV